MELETKAVEHGQEYKAVEHGPEIKQAFEDFLGGFEAFKQANDERARAQRRHATLTRPCGFGVTIQDFWSGPPWRWDEVNNLCVKLTNGALSLVSDAMLLGGANALAVQNDDGGWEVVQFANAALTAPDEYVLTRLRRGRRGSEGQMRSPVAAGARVVVLDSALAQLGLSQSQARSLFQLRWGPASRPVSDSSWQGAAMQFEAAALLPLAPCHVGFAWNAAGDLTIGWRRRDRAPAAAHLTAAVTPMSEAAELYDLEITNGGSVVRTFAAIPQHSQIYTAAQQAADFPSGLPNPLLVNVPWGAVRLLDAAAGGADPDTVAAAIAPGQPDDAASDVKLSEAVALLAADLGIARQNADQLGHLEKAAVSRFIFWETPPEGLARAAPL